ncbi:hypothetical protein PIB30_006678 [Stylosanthes scabra]|uniref:DUF1677 family protein n=1 Tax=Stylosanthes scabra TaxID=79078 RepID=A0ABU6R5K3_9FABA|nr:hypothetical protein [Stylosanthes scabra]
MAPPHGDSLPSSTTFSTRSNNNLLSKPSKLSSESLQRTISDISFELAKEAMIIDSSKNNDNKQLPAISEVEDGKCECCGMSEECTLEYMDRVRNRFLGKFVCGLCSEAVKEELEKNGGKKEEALSSHMSACVRFNKFGRAFPVLYQAEAMKEMLKKSKFDGKIRAKSISPREKGGGEIKGGLARSSSCIPTITKEFNDIKIAH